MRVFVVCLLAVVLSGCLSASPKSVLAPTLPLPLAAPPPGCDAHRVALVHGLGGADVTARGPTAVGCLLTTAWGSGEPSIGLDSKGTLYLYPAFGTTPLPGPTLDRANGLGMARSRDHGLTWTHQVSKVAGLVNWHPTTADPFMYVDPATGRVFMEDLIVPPFNCSNLSFSDDGGETWTQTLGGCLEWDHVSYGSGKPTVSATQGYPDVVYRCAIEFVMTTLISEATACQKSLDGGLLWQPPGDPAFLFGPDGTPYVPSTCNGAAHHLFVDHRGWLWLPRGWCGSPYVALSKDEGATWQRFKISDERLAGGGHDAGVAVDTNGTVYYFWVRSDLKPYLSVSHDEGKTWSAPVAVAPPGLKAAGNPSMTAGGAGKIGLAYAANFDFDGGKGVHGVVAVGYGADGPSPTFQSALVNPKDAPIDEGACDGYVCPGQADFVTITLGPDGAPWSSYMNRNHLAAGTIWGAPSLWDPSDPNGRYG